MEEEGLLLWVVFRGRSDGEAQGDATTRDRGAATTRGTKKLWIPHPGIVQAKVGWSSLGQWDPWDGWHWMTFRSLSNPKGLSGFFFTAPKHQEMQS